MDEIVELRGYSSRELAQLDANLLADHGIKSTISAGEGGAAYSGVGFTHLYVLRTDVAIATELLKKTGEDTNDRVVERP